MADVTDKHEAVAVEIADLVSKELDSREVSPAEQQAILEEGLMFRAFQEFLKDQELARATQAQNK